MQGKFIERLVASLVRRKVLKTYRKKDLERVRTLLTGNVSSFANLDVLFFFDWSSAVGLDREHIIDRLERLVLESKENPNALERTKKLGLAAGFHLRGLHGDEKSGRTGSGTLLIEAVSLAGHNLIAEDCRKVALGPSRDVTNPSPGTIEVFVPRSILTVSSKQTTDRNLFFTTQFTRNIIESIIKLGHPVMPIIQGDWRRLGIQEPANLRVSSEFPSFSWHTRGTDGNRVHLKYGSYPGFFSMDRSGYAGFSDFATRPVPMSSSRGRVERNFRFLRGMLVDQKISKYAQPEPRVFSPPARPYIFFPMQIHEDTVSQLRFLEVVELVEGLLAWCQKNDFLALAKKHPQSNSRAAKHILRKFRPPFGWVVEGNVHSIIERSAAVVTVNSGVGAEALLHLKPVVTGGLADYNAVSHSVKSAAELHQTLDRLRDCDFRVDEIFLKNFLLSYTTEYMPHWGDQDSIGRITHRLLSEISLSDAEANG